jgi:hypothetical protein
MNIIQVVTILYNGITLKLNIESVDKFVEFRRQKGAARRSKKCFYAVFEGKISFI